MARDQGSNAQSQSGSNKPAQCEHGATEECAACERDELRREVAEWRRWSVAVATRIGNLDNAVRQYREELEAGKLEHTDGAPVLFRRRVVP